MQVAEEAFSADGVAVGMDDIARAARLGVGTLYRHFPTKEALFLAIVRRHLEQLNADGLAALDDDDPGEAFFHFIARMVEEAGAKRNVLEALLEAGIDASHQMDDLKAELNATVGHMYERAKGAGAVRGDIAMDELLPLLFGTCMAMCRLDVADSTRRKTLDVLFDGLRPPRSR